MEFLNFKFYGCKKSIIKSSISSSKGSKSSIKIGKKAWLELGSKKILRLELELGSITFFF